MPMERSQPILDKLNFEEREVIVRNALLDAFASWSKPYPGDDNLLEDPTSLETKGYVKKLKGKIWKQVLEEGDLSILPFFLSKEAWLYFLPAILALKREPGVVGHDLWLSGIPPTSDPYVQVITIEELTEELTDKQLSAIKLLIELHFLRAQESEEIMPNKSEIHHLWNYWQHTENS